MFLKVLIGVKVQKQRSLHVIFKGFYLISFFFKQQIIPCLLRYAAWCRIKEQKDRRTKHAAKTFF